jgi:ribosomal protein S18 acetylase RimI-like enzyme
MNSCTTRKTLPSDFAFIYNLHRQTMYEYVAKTWGWQEEVQIKGMREDFDRLMFEIICDRDLNIGVISVVEQENNLFLNYLAFLPQYQRQGFGTQVLRRIMQQAEARGISVKLNVMKANPAQRFYEHLGFEAIDIDEDRYMMEWHGNY